MDTIINKALGLVEKYLARPLVGRVILVLLTTALSVAILAFAGDWRIAVNGKIGTLGVSLRYDNESQTAVCLIVATVLSVLALWLFRRYHRPAHFRSDRIAELEDMYAARGAADSVRQKFREVYSVWVVKDELDYLMNNDRQSELAASLRKARAQVNFRRSVGFVKTKPDFPYKVTGNVFVGVYVLAALACLFCALLALAFAFQHLWSGFVAYFLGFTAFVVVAWVSLETYGACYHTLELTGPRKAKVDAAPVSDVAHGEN